MPTPQIPTCAQGVILSLSSVQALTRVLQCSTAKHCSQTGQKTEHKVSARLPSAQETYQTTDDANVVILVEGPLQEHHREYGSKQHLSSTQHLHPEQTFRVQACVIDI